MQLFNVRVIFESFLLSYGILWFYEVESKLVHMYSTSDFHLETINWTNKLIVNNKLKYVLGEVFDCT